MSISSSDISKQAFNNVPIRQEQRTSDNFRTRQQTESKVIQTLSDTNKMDSNTSQGQKESVKIEPSHVEEMNKKMAQLNVHLSFETTEDGKKNIVKVVDQSTGDVVRQIPTEDFLKMSDRIDDIMNQLSDFKGTLVNSKV
ncbi:flagellar protein FlaG [Marinomonas flavescens]|uniref:flagellar protein FlaG n=1 Tax=Marinomonas flavescens TaxID=2529379 RepID=UPI0010554113|nr:flagellar protein FlaG [Marinomonas flavescens]